MADVKARVINREEALKLVERIIDHDAANYLIREELIERGLSAYEANDVISEVRRYSVDKEPNFFMDNIGIIIMLLIIISIFLYVLVSNVQ